MRYIAITAALALLAVYCLPLAAAGRPSDDLIYDQVRRKLAEDTTVKGGAIQVEVNQGVVTLGGRVRSEKQKNKAERLTRKVKGVVKVVNKLVVEP